MKKLNSEVVTPNYIDSEMVRHVIKNAKGQFMSMVVSKKCGEERTFLFKVCKDNAPTFEKHQDLMSIRETNGRYRSFNVNLVKSMTARKTLIKAA